VKFFFSTRKILFIFQKDIKIYIDRNIQQAALFGRKAKTPENFTRLSRLAALILIKDASDQD
jgi:hypothetical protein